MSDLAAKGAEPLGVLLGYSFGSDDARFVEGLSEALEAFDTPLLGGDTVSGNGPQSIGLTAIGRATHSPVPSRSGARAGDRVWVSGPLGAAMLGYEALVELRGDGESAAYRRPTPLLAEGRALAPHVTAMMDISDGLLLDASRMAAASGVTLSLDAAAVPLAPGLSEARRGDALRWGDDYQLLFAAPEGFVPPCDAFAVGTVLAFGDSPLLVDGAPPAGRLGYLHGRKG